MTTSDIKIYIISLAFLLLAEFIWNFFMLAGALFILKQKAVLYSKSFYFYILYATFASTITDRGISFIISNVVYMKNLWLDGSVLVHLGFMAVPIVLLTTFHYYLISRLFDFDAKTKFKMALILGLLTAPWPTFFSV